MREEGGCETFPDRGRVEGEEEFDRGAGEEGCEDGIYGAVDVMEGKDVQESIRGAIFPRGG